VSDKHTSDPHKQQGDQTRKKKKLTNDRPHKHPGRAGDKEDIVFEKAQAG